MRPMIFVKLPKRWENSPVVKRLYPGTRWFVERGAKITFRHWLEELHEAYPGNLIPLQWVAEYVGVSRAAVHQRGKNGGLTVFSYIVQETRKTILGGLKDRDSRMRFDYAVKSECDHWHDLLLEYADGNEDGE